MKKSKLLPLLGLLVLLALTLCSCGDSQTANFYFIIVPFAALFRLFDKWFSFPGGYFLTLFLFALVVKVVFLPFSIMQQKNQIKGAKLRPKMALIEKKYAGRTDMDSQQKKRQELMDLQQRENYSPASGCLPMLLQLVVVIVLYGIIRAPLTYMTNLDNNQVAQIYNAAVEIDPAYKSSGKEDGFVFDERYVTLDVDARDPLPWKEIKNIDQYRLLDALDEHPDDFAGKVTDYDNVRGHLTGLKVGKLNLAKTPGVKVGENKINLLLLLIPVLNFALAVLTTKLTKKYSGNLQAELAGQSPDQKTSNAIMEWMMPFMNLAFTFMFQAVLGLYWIYQSVLAVGQIVLLNKLMPMPTFTEEDIQAYKKSINARPAANSDPDRPKPRSLHHIDDDDDDIPAAPRIDTSKRNPNTSKKKAESQDARQHQAERDAAREAREQRKEEERAAEERTEDED